MFTKAERSHKGFTLIEMVVFIVVISITLAGFIKVIAAATQKSVDPVLKVSALNRAQSMLDSILARKFDDASPVGGIPACGTVSGSACSGINPDSNFDDVGDFNGFVDTSFAPFTTSVSVVNAGTQLGIPNTAARLITVNVLLPNGDSIMLSAFKVNF